MFTYEMPTKLYFGKGCVAQSVADMAALGKKALIVTGRSSAKRNGSQDAVVAVLESAGLGWVLFDEVEANPSVETVRNGAELGRKEQVDFVIGIGGGSPMDAAKVIALLCTNDLDDEMLFTGPYGAPPLPIVTVPTTSGTGSEVTKISILTNHKAGTKQGVKSPMLYPKLSLADPSFTMGVPEHVTIDTAIDALSHAIEGYMAKDATPVSDVWAEEALRFFGLHLTQLRGTLSYAVREDLMYASTLAGIVISQAGTTLVHGMGYCLTYYKGFSHGRANGLLLPQYMKLMEESMADKAQRVWELLGFAGSDDFEAFMKDLMPDTVTLSEEEIEKFTTMVMKTASVKATSYDVTAGVVARMYAHISK